MYARSSVCQLCCILLALTITVSRCSSSTGLHLHRHVDQQQHPRARWPTRGLGVRGSGGGGQYRLLHAPGWRVQPAALPYMHSQPDQGPRWENQCVTCRAGMESFDVAGEIFMQIFVCTTCSIKLKSLTNQSFNCWHEVWSTVLFDRFESRLPSLERFFDSSYWEWLTFSTPILAWLCTTTNTQKNHSLTCCLIHPQTEATTICGSRGSHTVSAVFSVNALEIWIPCRKHKSKSLQSYQYWGLV